jgi:hypothetical protein
MDAFFLISMNIDVMYIKYMKNYNLGGINDVEIEFQPQAQKRLIPRVSLVCKYMLLLV